MTKIPTLRFLREITDIGTLESAVVNCQRCPRLVEYCTAVAAEKRRAFRDWDYWGRPVPSFGDPAARILVVGLAPAAHGANRTGRMFTGDRSGLWLYRALYEAGLANQPDSTRRGDGLELRGVYITATVRCAPPGNKPLPEEIRNCRPYLEHELDLLPGVRVVVSLGKIAFDAYLDILKSRGAIQSRAAFAFGHNRQFTTGPGLPALVSCYHPSQQNTQTGKLTEQMLLDVFRRAKRLAFPGGEDT